MATHPSASGFSLIELLVVIVILGIVAGMVSLSVAPSEHRRMTQEVERLAALFRLANDEAHVSGQTIRWQADADGYRFLESEDVRGEGNDDDPLRPRAWPFEVRSIDAPDVEFGREPLMSPARMHMTTSELSVVLEIDAFGELNMAQ